MKKFIVSGVAAVFVAMLMLTVVFANTLSEVGDAGDLPSTAQVAHGTGVLTSIDGSISGGVGGTTTFLTVGSGSFSGSVALLSGGLAAAILVGGAWYARRRWLGSRKPGILSW